MNKILVIALMALFSVAPLKGEILTQIPVTEQQLFDYSLKRTVDYTIDFGFSESTNTPVREGDRDWGILDFATLYPYKPASGPALLKKVRDAIWVEAQKALYMHPVKTNVLLCARAVTDESDGYSMLWINYFFQVKQYPSGKFYVPPPTTNDLVIVYNDLFRFRFDNIDYAEYVYARSPTLDSRDPKAQSIIRVETNHLAINLVFLLPRIPGEMIIVHTKDGKKYVYNASTGMQTDKPLAWIGFSGYNSNTGEKYITANAFGEPGRNIIFEISTDFQHWTTTPEWNGYEFQSKALGNMFFRARYVE